MKIKYFFTPALEPLASATADMMAIYQIPAMSRELALQAGGTHPIKDVVYVEHQLKTKDNPPGLLTRLRYQASAGGSVEDAEFSRLGGEQDKAEVVRLAKVNTWRLLHRLTGADPSPWGILRGVRPTKIVHRLIDEGYSRQAAEAALAEKYLVSPQKASLVANIAARQRKWLQYDPRQVSVYIGVPFCPSRCLYCSFPASVIPANRQKLMPYWNAFKQDLAAAAALVRQQDLIVQSLYIGGGTPTSLAAEDLEELLSFAVDHFVTATTQEFTVEAGRPDSLDERKIALMQTYGVGRISINPQSMQEKTLKRIGRNHTVEDIINIFGKIRNSGFAAVNMDVIAGLPGETADDMRSTMDQILSLGPENVTVHTLAIKKGSALKEKLNQNLLPDDREVRDMLAIAHKLLTGNGLVPYYLYRQKHMTGQMENIGYCRPGSECLYNIQIMEERQSIIGIGPNSSTKFVDGAFHVSGAYMPKDVNAYIQGVQQYIDRRAALFAQNLSQEVRYVSYGSTRD